MFVDATFRSGDMRCRVRKSRKVGQKFDVFCAPVAVSLHAQHYRDDPGLAVVCGGEYRHRSRYLSRYRTEGVIIIIIGSSSTSNNSSSIKQVVKNSEERPHRRRGDLARGTM